MKVYWLEVVNDVIFITDKQSGEAFYDISPAPRSDKSIKYSFGGEKFNYSADQLRRHHHP